MVRVLVFGEDENDCRGIVEIIRPILGDRFLITVARKPIIFARTADDLKQRKNANAVANVVALWQAKGKVKFIVLHHDADAVEPAHVKEIKRLKAVYRQVGVGIVPAVPAFEMESWFFLFPEAVSSYRKCWRSLGAARSCGSIVDAKERLRRETRNSSNGSCEDYDEGDAPGVAAFIAKFGVVAQLS